MTDMQEMAEGIAIEEARLRDQGVFKRRSDPDRVARHLATSEPKWGLERRRAINKEMALRKPGDYARFEVITYVRKTCGAQNMAHFYDHVAEEKDIRHIERILGL